MAERQAPYLVPLVRRIHAELRHGEMPAVDPHVAFYPYVETKSTVRERDGRLRFRLSDHLEGAPDEVLEGIVAILLCRYYGLADARAGAHRIDAYEDYVRSGGTMQRRTRSRKDRGRKHIDPFGAHRSLLESYLRVTMEMDLLVPTAPVLSWSKTRSRRRFGHWDADHNAIVLSRVLDDPKVPEYVLDYVVYHEILHIVYPPRDAGPRRRHVHPPEFTAAERRYPRWQEAEAWLTRLSRRR